MELSLTAYIIDAVIVEADKRSVDVWLTPEPARFAMARLRKVTVVNPPSDPYALLGLVVRVDRDRLWLRERVWAERIAPDTIQLLPDPKEESCNSHLST